MDTQNQNGVYYNPNPYLKPKKEYKPFTKNDITFLLLTFFAGFILIDFAIMKGFHLGFTISYLIIFVISTLYVFNKESKPSVFTTLCGALSLVAAVPLSLYYNALVNAFSVVLIIGLFTIYIIGISNTFKRSQSNFKIGFDMFETAAISPFESISEVAGSIKAGANKGKKYLSALLGIAVALPVLGVVIPLLVESDAAFEKLINIVLKNIGIYIGELIAACVILPYTYSLLFAKKHPSTPDYRKNKKTSDLRKIPVPGCISFLCVISITYLVYLFSQLAYFFSAFKGLLPEGYTRTASAFARRGFVEMFAICVINVLIISGVSAFSKRVENGKRSIAIKLFSLFISLFSLLLIATAMQKMKLNISTYGFTVNRLLVSILMVMTAVVLIFFIIHIFLPKVSYMQPLIIICSVIFIFAAFSNLDSITANYNVSLYTSGELKSVDIAELRDMGNESIPAVIELTKSKDKKVSHEAEMALIEMVYEKANFYNDDTEANEYNMNYGDFRAWYLSKEKAHKAIKEYENSLDGAKKTEYNKRVSMIKNKDYHYSGIDAYDDEDYFDNYENNKTYYYNPKTDSYDIEKKVYE